MPRFSRKGIFMAKKDFTRASAYSGDATTAEVQQAITMIAKAGFELDAEAYDHVRKGREEMKKVEDEIKKTHPDVTFSDAPGHTFFFRKADTHLSLGWDDAAGKAEIYIHDGAIGTAGETQNYTLKEFIDAKPFDKPSSRTQELADTLPEQWRKPFIRFVETGELSREFEQFLNTSKEGQKAVEVVFDQQAKAMEALARELKKDRNKNSPKR